MGFPLGTGGVSDSEDDSILDALLRAQGVGAYPTDPDSLRYGELAAWAEVHGLSVEVVHAVLCNIFVGQATELLDEWERALHARHPSSLTASERQRRLLALRAISGLASKAEIERIAGLMTNGACTLLVPVAASVAAEGSQSDGVLQTALVVPSGYDAHVGAPDVLRRMLPAIMYGQRWRARPEAMLALTTGATWGSTTHALGSAVLSTTSSRTQERIPSRYRDYSLESRLDAVDFIQIEAGSLLGACNGSTSTVRHDPGNERRVFFAATLGAGGTAVIIAKDCRKGLARIHIRTKSDTTDCSPGATYDVDLNTSDVVGESVLYTGTGWNGTTGYYSDSVASASGVRIYARSTDGYLTVSSVNARTVVGYVEISGDVIAGTGHSVPRVSSATADAMTLSAAAVTDTWFATMRKAISAGAGDPAACKVWNGFRAPADGNADTGFGGVLRVGVIGLSFAPVSGANTYVLDASMDWRDRLLHVDFGVASGATRSEWHPGGYLDVVPAYDSTAFGFTGTGVAVGSSSALSYHLALGASLRLGARSTDGALVLEHFDAAAHPFATCLLMIQATDQLAKRSSATPILAAPVPGAGSSIYPWQLNYLQDVGLTGQVVGRPVTPTSDEVACHAMPLGRLRRDGYPLAWRVGQRNGQLKHAHATKSPTNEVRQPLGPRARRIFSLAAVAHGDQVVVDSSIDWRDRIISVRYTVSWALDLTPGGFFDNSINTTTTASRQRTFYSSYGGERHELDASTTGLRLFVETDGTLQLWNEAISGTASVVAVVEASPRLGPRSDAAGGGGGLSISIGG